MARILQIRFEMPFKAQCLGCVIVIISNSSVIITISNSSVIIIISSSSCSSSISSISIISIVIIIMISSIVIIIMISSIVNIVISICIDSLNIISTSAKAMFAPSSHTRSLKYTFWSRC